MSTTDNRIMTDATCARIADALEYFVENYPVPTLIEKTIIENGTYNASSDNADGYSQVTVNVEGGLIGDIMPSTNIGNNGDVYTLRLPSNITYIDYIEGNGSLYIDTGLNGSNQTDFYIEALLPGAASGGDICGSRGASAFANACVCYFTTTTGINIRKSKSTDIYSIIPITSGASNKIATKSASYLTGININTCQAVTSENQLQTFTTPNTMMVMGVNKNGTPYPSSVRIYRLTIYEAGLLVGDYIPALNDGVPSMYNPLTGQFMPNIGTGTFSYGNTVSKPENIAFVKRSGVWVPLRGEF